MFDNFDSDEAPKAIDASALEGAIFRRMMDDLMSTPEALADDAERIVHALDALAAIEMPEASASAVFDVITAAPDIVRNYAVVEWSATKNVRESSHATADHSTFAEFLDVLRLAPMPEEQGPSEFGLSLGDPKEHVAVLLRATPWAWSTWASIVESIS